MDVMSSPGPRRQPADAGLYLKALDKLLRDTEDGRLTWRKRVEDFRPEFGGGPEITEYEAEAAGGTLTLRGEDDFGSVGVPFPTGTAPRQRGGARLYLRQEAGGRTPFPPSRTGALQSVLDDLLMAVRFQVEGPGADEFARRLLSEG